MPDFPALSLSFWAGGVITSSSRASMTHDVNYGPTGPSASSGVWPSANRAIYLPFIIEQTVTAYQMFFEVGTQSGNCDVGIYNENGSRVISKGSTAVAAAGLQAVDITDTVLTPALYFMAMNVDNITAAFIRTAPLALHLRSFGVQTQDVGAVTLPDPATFTATATAYHPLLGIALSSTI